MRFLFLTNRASRRIPPGPAPTGFTAAAVGPDRIDLNWVDAGGTYDVRVSADGFGGPWYGLFTGTGGSYSATGLDPATQYYFDIQRLPSSLRATATATTNWSPAVYGPSSAVYLPGPAWCFADADKTVPCGDGDPIYVRVDSLGRQPDLMQSDPTKRPVARLNGGGHPYVEWPLGSRMEVVSALNTNGPCLLAIRGGGGSDPFTFAAAVGNPNVGGIGTVGFGGTVGLLRGAVATTAGTVALSDAARNIAFRTPGGTGGTIDCSITVDGVTSIDATAAPYVPASGLITVVSYPDYAAGGSLGFDYGIVAAVADPDSDGTRAQLETYLASLGG